ncbi:uncharacterized protein LOC130782755 [Actinidia eriantha]|uniref:uncharacterized protein LOC130782755 n=1 Tax=Actinidia eriantha TaxID=165200 RepID=UPI00258486D0|nr:uncharacterized protein LOC130782755 [Actinidia eriantha]
MANPLIRKLRRSSLSLLLNLSLSNPIPFRPKTQFFPSRSWWLFRNMSHGSVHLVISQGNPKFETREIDPPRKEKWKLKKRLKQHRKREKQKRKAANKRDPRRICIKGKRKKLANAEERIKCKLEKVGVIDE